VGRVTAHTDCEEELDGENEGEDDSEEKSEDLDNDPARVKHDERDANEHPLLGAGAVKDPPQSLPGDKRGQMRSRCDGRPSDKLRHSKGGGTQPHHGGEIASQDDKGGQKVHE